MNDELPKWFRESIHGRTGLLERQRLRSDLQINAPIRKTKKYPKENLPPLTHLPLPLEPKERKAYIETMRIQKSKETPRFTKERAFRKWLNLHEKNRRA